MFSRLNTWPWQKEDKMDDKRCLEEGLVESCGGRRAHSGATFGGKAESHLYENPNGVVSCVVILNSQSQQYSS